MSVETDILFYNFIIILTVKNVALYPTWWCWNLFQWVKLRQLWLTLLTYKNRHFKQNVKVADVAAVSVKPPH